jgi:hypothetical protein
MYLAREKLDMAWKKISKKMNQETNKERKG